MAVAAAVWIAVVAAALGLAAALDEDPARPRQSVAPSGLPLLHLYLDRDLPREVLQRPTLAAQLQTLQRLAEASDDPARWVELGSASQRLGDLEFADFAFRKALEADPERLEAQVGLAVSQGATGGPGLDAAAATLSELRSRHPDSQLVAFNAALISVYRSDRTAAAVEFARARALGPTTPLGILAGRFGEAAAPTGNP